MWLFQRELHSQAAEQERWGVEAYQKPENRPKISFKTENLEEKSLKTEKKNVESND